MFTRILIWICERIATGKNRARRLKVLESVGILYKMGARADFEVHSRIVKVKKGSAKYKLLFLQNKYGAVRMQISRHL